MTKIIARTVLLLFLLAGGGLLLYVATYKEPMVGLVIGGLFLFLWALFNAF